MTCVFCQAPETAGEIVFDDARTWVMLHPDWSVRGHAMVVWRGHVQNVSDLDDDELQHFMRVYRDAERALLAATGAERAILLKLGLMTPHLHLHIYPVPATMDRAAVMRAIDAQTSVARDEELVTELRRRLTHDTR